jgi:predicted protein tyrosine phosphatase
MHVIVHIESTGRRAAEMLPPDHDIVIVSITDPWSAPANIRDTAFRDVLRLRFFDTTDPTVTLYRKQPVWGISTEQAIELVYWLDCWHAEPEQLSLVSHCEGGISRSAAVAEFAASRYGVRLARFTPHANSLVLKRLFAAATLLEALLSSEGAHE